jgi:hypothetical protein
MSEDVRERLAEKLWNDEQLVPWSRAFGNPDFRYDMEVLFERVDAILALISPESEKPEYPYCAFCEEPVSTHPEPLCSPGTVRDLREQLAEAVVRADAQFQTRMEELAERDEAKRRIGHYKAALEAANREVQSLADQLYASCICDPNPETTEGMLEDCPVHGSEEHRPLAMKAAIERVREAVAKYGEWLDGEDVLAALDAPGGGQPKPCPRCEGSMVEPDTEQEGDWVPGAMAHLPYTGEPCTACQGTGKAPASASPPTPFNPHWPPLRGD